MIFPSEKLEKLLRKVPGRKKFGAYRFLPGFFLFGAAIEFAMINWTVGEVNFYNTFKKKQVEEIVAWRLFLEEYESKNSD